MRTFCVNTCCIITVSVLLVIIAVEVLRESVSISPLGEIDFLVVAANITSANRRGSCEGCLLSGGEEVLRRIIHVQSMKATIDSAF